MTCDQLCINTWDDLCTRYVWAYVSIICICLYLIFFVFFVNLVLWRICIVFLWRTQFYGAFVPCAPQKCHIFVAHLAYMRHRYVNFCGAPVHAPHNSYFSGDDSVAHPICATESQNRCATDSQFPSSDSWASTAQRLFGGSCHMLCAILASLRRVSC